MKQFSIYMLFLFGFLFLLFRCIEKLKWFGGSRDEETPLKDGIFWIYLWFALFFIYSLIFQIQFMISLSFSDPKLFRLYYNQIFGIILLIFLIFIMLIKGFINPTLNSIIAFSINTTITLILLLQAPYNYSTLFIPLWGLIIGVIIHQILKKWYEKGNKILWEISKVWKIINNRLFLLGFTILFAVEMFLQIHQISITTLCLYF
ncbi:MAG: hypothetical protein ACTSR8_14275 [Promethearchaeota archaeon]